MSFFDDVVKHERGLTARRIRAGIEALRGYARDIERQLERENYELVCAEARNAGQHLVDIAEAAGKLVALQLAEKCLKEAPVLEAKAIPDKSWNDVKHMERPRTKGPKA